jgi:hypothetical protein
LRKLGFDCRTCGERIICFCVSVVLAVISGAFLYSLVVVVRLVQRRFCGALGWQSSERADRDLRTLAGRGFEFDWQVAQTPNAEIGSPRDLAGHFGFAKSLGDEVHGLFELSAG